MITLVINFAFWMQEDFTEGEEETGLIEVTFHDVTSYECIDDPAGWSVSILDTSADEDGIVIRLYDGINEKYFEMKISAGAVDVKI